ncbi:MULTISPECIES: tripartite tricarboxylate transporter substrate-binding protein [unclassified Acidovorax]|uniref:Bug family tripartite tricarboxylate transporter substrate binding protein n=1 Tax=unclassified Acidovorax TaxID=2684926 RepID=UPI002882E364|nr:MULTISPECIES: tripartite tricarboxylate transporter substrate-binding protein [unclassified Acidovorax]
MQRRLLAGKLLSGMLWGAGVSAAHAQRGHDSAAFPARPIRLVVPFAPGGSADLLARLIGRHLFARADAGVGRRKDARPAVRVDNVAGAGGNIGAALVARSPADGYTLEIGAMSTHAMNGRLYRRLPFDPVADFDTVAMLACAINVIAVTADLPVHTFAQLLAYLRAHPGRVNYASGGIGTHNHLTLALLAKTQGLDIVHVPYSGGGPAVAALLQGECQLFAGGASLLLPHVRSGRVRLIATTAARRSDLLPELPSTAETLPGYEVTNWYGVFAPRGLDPAVRQRLNREINRVTALPDVAHRLRSLGLVPAPLCPEQVYAILQADQRLWGDTIDGLGIHAE